MPLRIEVLGRQHRPLFEDFRNQHQSLVDYLRRFAPGAESGAFPPGYPGEEDFSA